MKKSILALAAACALATPTLVLAGDAEVKQAVEAWLGSATKVDSVRKAGFLNLYEVVVGGDVLYTDEKVTYVVAGNVIEAKTRKDLTEERKNKLSQIKFSELPLDLAVKVVKGNGKRVLATFEDPNCSYCKKLAKEIQGLNDITVYTFVYPILSADSHEKSKAIWCAADRSKAWTEYMVNNNVPVSGKCDTSGLDKVAQLARRLNIRGTPAMFLSDGTRVPGYMPAAKLDEAINKAAGG